MRLIDVPSAFSNMMAVFGKLRPMFAFVVVTSP